MENTDAANTYTVPIVVCIPTRNRPDDLARALASLGVGTRRPAAILVSDDSDDAIRAHVAAICAQWSAVTRTEGPRSGLARNMNHCLDHLPQRCDGVVFIDDDVVAAPSFLEEGWKHLRAHGPKSIVTGCEINRGHLVEPHGIGFLGHQDQPTRATAHGIVINATIFPRDLFQVVRFDAALRYGYEEADICAQAEAHGYHIYWHPTLRNHHFPSEINRDEYAAHIEISRLYATYKRYRWIDHNRRKALAFAVLGPLHLIAHSAKRQGLKGAVQGVATGTQALRLARQEARKLQASVRAQG